MKKILLSLATIGGVAALTFAVTGAFFSDTETSTGNQFVAGDIDLQIDNQSYVTDANGVLVASPGTSWSLKDLVPGVDHFFNFSDLKPGDLGEDTISIHVGSNSAWMCAAAQITADEDVDCTDPELADDGNCAVPGAGLGELDSSLNFAFWHDDGDNVLEDNEQSSIFLQGPLSGIGSQGKIRLADSSGSILGGSTPIPGNTTFYIGKAWCFGTLTPAPRPQGEGLSPLQGTGFTCNGSQVNNAAQTDKVVGDLQFYAVQSRNNSTFTCSGDYVPVWPEEKIGALLSAYDQPSGNACNVNVSDGGTEPNSITEGIAAAVNGNTVCVDAGTYDEDVVINKEITLAGDGASATSVINGQGAGQGAAVTIAANNVTLEGFEINGVGIAALWLNTGVSGATVRYNKITSASGVTAVTTQGSQSNHLFSNNAFVGTGASQLVYVNGEVSLVGFPSDNVDFMSNTFSGTIVAGGVALGTEATNSEMTKNIFKDTLTSTYAIAETWQDDAVFNFNNFNGVGGIKVRNGDAGMVNAENNWWGAAAPAGHTAGSVDDNPKEASAFPEN